VQQQFKWWWHMHPHVSGYSHNSSKASGEGYYSIIRIKYFIEETWRITGFCGSGGVAAVQTAAEYVSTCI
jgi:hypothetical protein